MLLTDDDVDVRLSSPLNLVNRLERLGGKKTTGMELFIPGPTDQNQLIEPSSDSTDPIDELVDEKKIKQALVKSLALNVQHDALMQLQMRLGEIGKVKDLSSIASEMNKILVEDSKKQIANHNQILIYKPMINDVSHYDTVVVRE
jgi:hypothetical protein